MGGGLFELRLKSKEGIGRVFFCTLAAQRIVMLHAFVKKSPKTPARGIEDRPRTDERGASRC
jgi:phage-related protein